MSHYLSPHAHSLNIVLNICLFAFGLSFILLIFAPLHKYLVFTASTAGVTLSVDVIAVIAKAALDAVTTMAAAAAAAGLQFTSLSCPCPYVLVPVLMSAPIFISMSLCLPVPM
jgi:hypothetical protein